MVANSNRFHGISKGREKMDLDKLRACREEIRKSNQELVQKWEEAVSKHERNMINAIMKMDPVKLPENWFLGSWYAPERRIFYVDVGNLPRAKAEQYIRDMMTK